MDLDWQVGGSGDLDGDGFADLMFRHADGEFYLWEMDGTTITAATSLGMVGSEWSLVS